MRALVLDGSTVSLTANHPDPQPKPGEAVIRPTRIGVCATDLELAQGYMGFQGVLGHEFVGIVEQVTEKQHADWIDRRVVGTINCVCGECDLCKKGLREHCRNRTVLGIQGRDGVMAEQFTLPIDNLLPVPDEVDDDHAVFTEPLAAAYQVLRQITVRDRPYITVLGDGRLGLLVTQVMSELNATVRCVGKHAEKLKLCEKWGVKHRLLDDVGLRQDQDIVVDCTGSPEGLTTALGMVRPRGTVVLKTTTAPPKNPTLLAPVVVDEVTIIGSRCGPFPQALDALAKGQVDVASLISKRMKLADGPDVLKAAAQPDVIKVLVEP